MRSYKLRFKNLPTLQQVQKLHSEYLFSTTVPSGIPYDYFHNAQLLRGYTQNTVTHDSRIRVTLKIENWNRYNFGEFISKCQTLSKYKSILLFIRSNWSNFSHLSCIFLYVILYYRIPYLYTSISIREFDSLKNYWYNFIN